MPERPPYSYTLQFRAPVGVFTGLGVAGLVDRTAVRDATGLPYIPGSSVKGRLRFFMTRVLNHATVSTDFFVHAHNQPHCKDVDNACTLCRLFGNPAIPGFLYVGQASPSEPWSSLFQELLAARPNPVFRADADIRPGIAISRQRRVALTDHLFFDETVPAISFSGTLLLDVRVSDKEADLLVGVGALVDALGARKAIGRGRLEGGIQIVQVGS